MRAFIALELPDAFWRETGELARTLAECVPGRFMRRDTYHITLAFLGEISDFEKGLAVEAIDAACTGMEPIALASDGLGRFGRAGDATLWMGVKSTEELLVLAKRVREELDARQLSYDGKAFRPHITLARRARIPKGALPALGFPLDDTASEVTLFKSELSHEGASYKPLFRVSLSR